MVREDMTIVWEVLAMITSRKCNDDGNVSNDDGNGSMTMVRKL